MKYNAHVRARRRIESRVIARFRDWDGGTTRKHRRESFDDFEAALKVAVSRAVGQHRWNVDSWKVYGAYSPFEGHAYVRVAKDVPTHEIHNIMCHVRENLPPARETRPK